MKAIGVMLLSCIVLAGCATAPVTDRDSDDEAISEMSREDLERENRALKKENRRLRRELVRQREGEPKVDLTQVRERKGVAGEETNGKATDDGGYWLATEKMRRHNSKCKYYKLGRGRPCEKDEGTPCKRCGG